MGTVALISTYELGHQPFGLASLAAWLKEAGADVTLYDLSLAQLDEALIVDADMVAFSVPMHTATRLAVATLGSIKERNPGAHICFFGLYAPMNEPYLRSVGADSVIGGEFETGVVDVYRQITTGDGALTETPVSISLGRQRFLVPERASLPALDAYARLHMPEGETRIVGYTEATRGCKHLCRHCPIVPVYDGVFVVVQPDVVLEDIRRQVAAGAQHITFGDPDFFNGPAHALRIVRQMHEEFPGLTFDATVKVEHLLTYGHLLSELVDAGCVLVTSAIESFDDDTLAIFDKQHTLDDLEEVIATLDEVGLALNPTFVAFTPWTTLTGYTEFLATVARLGLVPNVSSVQYAIRLLIPANSRLLELPEVADIVAPFDGQELAHPWKHPDPAVDRLCEEVLRIVAHGQTEGHSRVATFNEIWIAANAARGVVAGPLIGPHDADVLPVAAVPYLTEPWYC